MSKSVSTTGQADPAPRLGVKISGSGRPRARARGATVRRSRDGASVAFTAQAAGMHPARIIRPGGTACGRGNGSRHGGRFAY